jgi:hypothetical protein
MPLSCAPTVERIGDLGGGASSIRVNAPALTPIPHRCGDG